MNDEEITGAEALLKDGEYPAAKKRKRAPSRKPTRLLDGPPAPVEPDTVSPEPLDGAGDHEPAPMPPPPAADVPVEAPEPVAEAVETLPEPPPEPAEETGGLEPSAEGGVVVESNNDDNDDAAPTLPEIVPVEAAAEEGITAPAAPEVVAVNESDSREEVSASDATATSAPDNESNKEEEAISPAPESSEPPETNETAEPEIPEAAESAESSESQAPDTVAPEGDVADGDENDPGEEAATEDEDSEEGDAEEGEAPGEGESLLPFNGVVEALLFAAPEALAPKQIGRCIGRGIKEKAVRDAVDTLNRQYAESGRAFEIAEIAGKFQMLTRPEYAAPVRRMFPKQPGSEKDKEKSRALAPAARDTLAIIVYKQPVTRAEIQAIRGVDCGPALRTLVERGTVRIVGKKAEMVGQPLLYGTTESFLREYGLANLDEVPFIQDLRWLTGTNDPLPESSAGDESPAVGEEADSGAPPAPEAEPETPAAAEEIKETVDAESAAATIGEVAVEPEVPPAAEPS